MNENNILKLFHIEMEKEYKNGRRITIDDCITICIDTLRMHNDAVKYSSLKKYFREMGEIDKMEIKDLFEIKKIQENKGQRDQ